MTAAGVRSLANKRRGAKGARWASRVLRRPPEAPPPFDMKPLGQRSAQPLDFRHYDIQFVGSGQPFRVASMAGLPLKDAATVQDKTLILWRTPSAATGT